MALIDHDLAIRGDAVSAVAAVRAAVPRCTAAGCWQRCLRLVDAALAARGVELVTRSAAYRSAHELPGWYRVMGSGRRSVWTEGDDLDALVEVAGRLDGGAAVLRTSPSR